MRSIIGRLPVSCAGVGLLAVRKLRRRILPDEFPHRGFQLGAADAVVDEEVFHSANLKRLSANNAARIQSSIAIAQIMKNRISSFVIKSSRGNLIFSLSITD